MKHTRKGGETMFNIDQTVAIRATGERVRIYSRFDESWRSEIVYLVFSNGHGAGCRFIRESELVSVH